MQFAIKLQKNEPFSYVGKTVSIRTLLPTDATLIHSWMQEKFFYYYKPYLKSICPTQSLLAQRIKAQTSLEPPFEIEALVLQHHLDKPIGIIALSNIDNTNLKAEFSVAFRSGLCTRCVAETIAFIFQQAFSTLKFNKLYFYITSDNSRILKMLKRYNFMYEGLLHEELLSENGEWLDLHRFCILRRDWTQNPLFKKLIHITEALK